MHLSVTCPRCESKYQLDAGMRGKRMRCPNPICRAVFEVRDDNDPPVQAAPPAEAPKPEPPAPPIAAKVVDAPKPPEPPKVETVKTKPPATKPRPVPKPIEPQPATDFPDDFPGDDDDPPVQAAPPPIEAKPVEPPKPAPVASSPSPPKSEGRIKPTPKPVEPPPADFPDDFPGDDEAAPATSGPAIATEAWQPEAEEAPPVREAPEPIAAPVAAPAPVKRQRALWIISAMLLVLAVGAGAAFFFIRGGIASNEAERFQKAEELYKEHQFADASAALQKLHRDFPDSPHSKKYRFLAELSDVRQAVYARESPDDTVNSLQRMLQLAGTNSGDPLLKERGADLWETFEFLASELTRLAEREKAPALMPHARRAWAEAKKYPAPSGMGQTERKLENEWTRIDEILKAHVKRQNLVDALDKLLEQTNAAAIQEAYARVEESKLKDDADIRKLLDKLVTAHREQIRFVTADSQSKAPKFDDDAMPSLSVTPSVKAERAVAGSKDLVISLARGVLYALEPAKGEVRWVRRLGIDTTVLPLRVPADAITPELLLALSSDQRSLSALIADTGEVLWQSPLSEACLGPPVLVDRQVLVPTVAGRIDEIEIAEGRLLGSYAVGQALTLGGVRQPGTPFVYFPADEFCVYGIDVTKRTCKNILYTRHPAGSLRGLPPIVTSDSKSYLLWSQAKGLDKAEIKPYELPLAQPEQKPVEPIVQLPGLSAPPWCDGDRLAIATQTGALSLWGVRQKGTLDALLFPLLKQDFEIEASKQPGRCQVVHADAENYWTLTRGRLQRVQSLFDPKEGPGLLKRWTNPIALGTMLHAAQARREPDGRTVLYVTTQGDEQPTCLCSAIDADDGKILWQRQLGVLPLQAPVVVAGQIVMGDARGLLRFAPENFDKNGKAWGDAGERLAHEEWRDAERILLVRESTYVYLTLPRGSMKLSVQIGEAPGDRKPRSLDVMLPAPLQGTPALEKGFLLLPLAEADGIMGRIDLETGALTKDLNWRAAGAELHARGHIVLWNTTDGVLTDGSRGIIRIGSSDGKTWTKRLEKQLAHRITSSPVVIPTPEAGKTKLCVADASDTLTLLDSDRLNVLQSWSMPGKITAGPFVRAGKLGCVVGRNLLVWLDPNEKQVMWQYDFADIVGEPHLIDGDLIVADVAGRFVALDPKDGRPQGPVLTLKANVAATATPLRFGAGQVFVPLTDGTVVILPLEKLRAVK